MNSIPQHLPPVTCTMPPMAASCASPMPAAFDAMRVNQISQIGLSLRNFVSHCDHVLNDLSSAHSTEMLDASTSNWSLVGWFISNSSYQKNHTVANEVDALQQEAWRINQQLVDSGVFARASMIAQPLNTDFNGMSIRRAEDAEHSFLADWFTGSAYSSFASTDTMSQLSMTSNKVHHVRNQAANMLYTLNSMQAGPFMAAKL